VRDDPPLGILEWLVMILLVAGLAFAETRCCRNFPYSQTFGPEDAQP
jgi:hypothetical protein